MLKRTSSCINRILKSFLRDSALGRSKPRTTHLNLRSLEPIARSVERVEDRTLLAANLHVTSVSLTNVAPVDGEQGYGRIDYAASDLPVDAVYDIEYKLDGVPVTLSRTSGAGLTTSNWAWIYGGWILSPGNHTLQITLDSSNTVAEADETDNTSTISFSTSAPTTLPQKLLWPLADEQANQYAVVNYVDVDPRGGQLGDFEGGPFVYDGHNGIDLTVANFTQMDSGIPILTAATGTVVEIQDSNFDREMSGNSNPGNYVTIDHGSGWKTVYYHLLANSVTVKIGQTISAGQVLGLMGSSGNSTDAHLHFMLLHNDNLVEPFYNESAYFVAPLPVFQGDQTPYVEDFGVTNYSVFADFKERPSSHEVFSITESAAAWFWYRLSHLNAGDAIKVRWYRPDNSLVTEFSYTATEIERHTGHGWFLNAATWSNHPGTWHVAVSLDGTELARSSFEVVGTSGIPEILLRDANSRLIPDGRTTPFSFGSVAKDAMAPTQVYTVENHGGTTLNLSSVVLPPGFTLASSPVLTIVAGGSTTFTVQMDSTVPGEKFGAVRVLSNDLDEAVYDFNVSGIVLGSPAAGTPVISMPDPAARYVATQPPVPVSPSAVFTDSDSTQFNNGTVTIEFASGAISGDTLTLLNQGNAAGQIGVNGSILSYGGTVIGTYSPGSANAPLAVTLNASSSRAAIQALLRAAAYSNNSTVSTSPRYVRFTVADDAGKISNQPVNMVVTEFGAPVVSTLSPTDGAANVGVSTNLVATFNEIVAKGTGNIFIKKTSDNSIVQTIDVASAAVTVSGTVVTINPSNLAGNTSYYVEIAATAFKDVYDNFFSGIAGATTWNFTTVNSNVSPTGTVMIDDMTPTENQLLLASNNIGDNDGLGTLTYTWERADNLGFTNNVTPVGTNTASFTPGDAEVGKFLRVTVSYIDGIGNAESVSSNVTSAVTNVNDIPSGTVSIDAANPVKDQLLTASNSLADNDGLGPFTFLWERADNAGFTTNVMTVGTNGATFTPSDSEVGKFLRVSIHYTDGNGTPESVSSAVTATVTVATIADTPSVTNAVTDINTQTASGLVISRDAADRPEITHFRITNIFGGALFQNDGTSAINNGDFITFAQGHAGLKFTPLLDSTESGHFTIQASTTNADTGLAGNTVTADITVKPAVPVVTQPASVTLLQRPTITWNAAPGAEQYVVSIRNQTGGNSVILKAVTGTTFTPPAVLGIGVFTVRVRAISASGTSSSYSADRTVKISTPVVSKAVTRFQSTANPGLTWASLPGAVKYDLWINNLTTGQSQVVRDINLSQTSWTSQVSLPMGGYRAWIRGIDAVDTPATWSKAVDFYVLPTVPVTGSLQSTFDRTPTFRWSAVAGATGYDLYLRNLNTGQIVSTPKDIAGTSFTQSVSLVPGNYRWSVYAVTLGGYRSQAATTQDIEVGILPRLLTPAASTSDTTPEFSWTSIGNAATYVLHVNRVDVSTPGIVNVSGIAGTTYTTDALPIGSYRAWVRAVSAEGEFSPWNVLFQFSITDETVESVTIPKDVFATQLSLLDDVTSAIINGPYFAANEDAQSTQKPIDATVEDVASINLNSVRNAEGLQVWKLDEHEFASSHILAISVAADDIMVDALMADTKSLMSLLEI